MLQSSFEFDGRARFGWFTPDPGEPTVIDGIEVVTPVQTHSLNVVEVVDPEMTFPDTDALVTRLSGVRIGIRTADCIPALIYAPDIHAVAVAHAGWKGTLGGIVRSTVEKLVDMGADVRRVEVRFGPGICMQCFEVGDELAASFRDSGFGEYVMKGDFIDRIDGTRFNREKWHIDLIGVNRRILLESGVQPNRIRSAGICTRHDTFRNERGETCRLPSWRRESGTELRMVSWASVSNK